MTDQTTPCLYIVKIDCEGRKFSIPSDLLQPYPGLLECFRDKHRKNPEGVIERNGESPNVYDCLFQYFRADDYAISDIGAHGESEGSAEGKAVQGPAAFSIQDTLMLHAGVFEKAIDYDLVDLQGKAARKFHQALKKSKWTMDDIFPCIDSVCDNWYYHAQLRPIRNALLDAVLPVGHDLAEHSGFWDLEDKGKYFGFLHDLIWLLSMKANQGEAVTGWSGESDEKGYKEACMFCEKRHS